MTNINLDLAVKLDGSETHMIAVLVDSWGDKLVVPLNCEMVIEPADYFIPCAHCGNAVLECNFDAGMDTCDRCNADSSVIELNPEDHATYIKSGVGKGLSKQDMDKLMLIHTLPEDLMEVKEELVRQEAKLKENIMEKMKVVDMSLSIVCNPNLNLDKRIEIAAEAAQFAFWDAVALSFPEASGGDFLMSDMEDIMLSWVKHWVETNVPIKQSHSGSTIDDLTLR